MNVKAKELCPPKEEVPKWGLVTYRVRFNLWNIYICVDDVPTTDFAEAERKLEQVLQLEGVTMARIAATRDFL